MTAVNRRPKVEVDGYPGLEEAVEIAIVERLDSQDVRARLQAGNGERAAGVHRKTADEGAAAWVEGNNVGAGHSCTVLCHTTGDAARFVSERTLRVEV